MGWRRDSGKRVRHIQIRALGRGAYTDVSALANTAAGVFKMRVGRDKITFGKS